MHFPEIERFIEWYRKEKKIRGLSLPIHYCFKKNTFTVTDDTITRLQLIVIGVTRVTIADKLTLEAIFQLLNDINSTANNPSAPRPDVF